MKYWQKKLWLLSFLILSILTTAFYQNNNTDWQDISSPTTNHLRGLSVVNDKVVWASGAQGTFLMTKNGGKKWTSGQIPGAEELDFRDIHAFDKKTALVLSAGEVGSIYKTRDGGKNWERTYHNTEKGIFFDGMDFADEKRGIAFGDPIDGKLVVVQTKDGGNTWQKIKNLPNCIEGEAGFAASGTGIVYNGKNIWIATGGGEKARIFQSNDDGISWTIANTKMISGEGKGIFSMTMVNDKIGVAVGGSYIDSTANKLNCAYTEDGGNTWVSPTKNTPNGYRSCVAYKDLGKTLIAVGRTGTDVSYDFGKTWIKQSEEAYYVCGVGEKWIYGAGRSGKLGKILLKK